MCRRCGLFADDLRWTGTTSFMGIVFDDAVPGGVLVLMARFVVALDHGLVGPAKERPSKPGLPLLLGPIIAQITRLTSATVGGINSGWRPEPS